MISTPRTAHGAVSSAAPPMAAKTSVPGRVRTVSMGAFVGARRILSVLAWPGEW